MKKIPNCYEAYGRLFKEEKEAIEFEKRENLKNRIAVTLAYYLGTTDFKEELRIDYADKAGKIWQEYLEQNPIRQAKLSQNVSLASPACMFTRATEIIAGTDLESHFRFLEQARRYRQELIQHLRDQKAFGSATWYERKAGEKIVMEAIPVFKETPESLSFSFKKAMPYIIMLLLLNIILFLSTYALFMRYNVK